MVRKKLADKEEEHLITTEGAQSDLVVGAPHHALAGIKKLPCTPERPADQNTGYVAWEIASLLQCSSVIAVNASGIDPNKDLSTPYAEAVADLDPEFLIEVHGHGGGKARADVEISAGSHQRNVLSTSLAKELRNRLQGEDLLKELTICGDFGRIYYRATRTATIQHEGWIGIHIELPLWLRKERDGSALPEDGQIFCRHLAATIDSVV